MSLITPPSKSKGGKFNARKAETARLYAHSLPLVLSQEPSRIQSILSFLGLSLTRIENPHCEGVFDPYTRSVWVSKSDDVLVLWRRGFFGKGDLSRSEPSWYTRQLNLRKSGGKQVTSEEVTAKRRAERRQFKADRAKAIAAVAEEAELIFATEGRVITPALSGPAIPSAATWKPSQSSSNTASVSGIDASSEPINPSAISTENIKPPSETAASSQSVLEEELDPLADVEHLQLTLQEAFFLLWTLDCLTVLDPHTSEPMTLQQIWTSFQTTHLPPAFQASSPSLSLSAPLQFDNPFFIHYMVYHHYRSLGWVVKGGIKFCVDYLLYKRGPVFSHAEFALVVCPVYEDPEDQAQSTLNLENSHPFPWSWLSTINRVNSQVQKTLVLVYVTIPARSRVSLEVLLSPACLAHYSIREVVLRRFVPARMRD
ncbi:putative tRNA-splicing endonuclease subunit sen2 [Leucoagaricus sp. SymC.cos]|nr:putative tRNA-splicing endonuclease subunit sen2 [Leucoagaricus sp. SymC.cos]